VTFWLGSLLLGGAALMLAACGNSSGVATHVVALAGPALTCDNVDEQMSSEGDTGVQDASGDTGSAQTEQTLAVDPTNPDNVVIGYITGVSVSHDGGRTWALAPISCSGDNNPAFDRNGMAYFECDNNGVEYYTSNHAADPWTGPLSAVSFTENNGDLVDRPWLVHGVGQSDLVVGWESFFSNPIGRANLKVSSDGGATWGAERYICVCKRVHGQFDPLVEVVPNTGAVYAVWMNDFNIVFSKSTNHGSTWSTPVPIYGNVSWGDKPNLGMSADGRDIYVLFNGPTDGDVYAAVSHDSGATWTQTRVTNDNRYHYDYGVTVLPNGRVLSSQISFTYTGPGAAAEGELRIHVYASSNGGTTWTDTIVDRVQLGSACTSQTCYPDFYDSGPVLAQTTNGVTLVYTGATTVGAARTAWSRSSTDGGVTWSPRVTVSSPGANAGFAAAAGSGTSVRLWYGEQVGGRWNVWYRTSTTLGASWSAPLKISDATSGTAYKNANGFLEVYGDYGEIAVTNTGKTIGVWAEGSSYAGPGQVWFNRET